MTKTRLIKFRRNNSQMEIIDVREEGLKGKKIKNYSIKHNYKRVHLQWARRRVEAMEPYIMNVVRELSVKEKWGEI